MTGLGKFEVEAILQNGEMTITVWGKRLIVAYVPDDITMTDELAERLARMWNKLGRAIDRELVRKLAQTTQGD